MLRLFLKKPERLYYLAIKKFERLYNSLSRYTPYKMSCIFKIFQKKNHTDKNVSIIYKFNNPLPATLDELHPIEMMLRSRLQRLNKRYETANKDLTYAREKNEMHLILKAMKLRRESEDEFKVVKEKLTELLEKKRQLGSIEEQSRIPTLMLHVEHNHLHK